MRSLFGWLHNDGVHVEKLVTWGHRPAPVVEYPDSDGQPMADNTLQADWIILLKTNLDLIVPDFVAADLLWYPVEGDPKTRAAPDCLVAFGRPKGYRGSYKQWEEDKIAPQIVMEVLSPGNRYGEMANKLSFYDRFGVEEYFVIDPYDNSLAVHVRRDGHLQLVPEWEGFASPRLGIRFERPAGALRVLGPDGSPFTDLATERARAALAAKSAEQEKTRAEQEKTRAEQEKTRAEKQQQRADALAARLRAMGVDPDQIDS